MIDLAAAVSIAALVITSPFGVDRGDHMHKGVDLACKKGTPIETPFDGEVVVSTTLNGYGKALYIHNDRNKGTIRMAHFSKLLVSVGDRVRVGQPVGLCGSTGASTGPHVHIEFRYGDPWKNSDSLALPPLKALRLLGYPVGHQVKPRE